VKYDRDGEETYRKEVIAMITELTKVSAADIESSIAHRKQVVELGQYDLSVGLPLDYEPLFLMCISRDVPPIALAIMMINDERGGGFLRKVDITGEVSNG